MFSFRMVPIKLDGKGNPQLDLPELDPYDVVTTADFGGGFPATCDDLDTLEEAEIAARRAVRHTLLEGIGRGAAGVKIRLEDLETNTFPKEFDVIRGNLICPGCFAIDPLDGPVMSPARTGAKTRMVASWLHDRDTGMLCYAPVYGITNVICKRCGKISLARDTQTNVEVATGESPVRFMGLRRERPKEKLEWRPSSSEQSDSLTG
jgi:hypothetical protein